MASKSVMLTLGDFDFEVSRATFDKMSFSKRYSWSSQQSLGQKVDALSYVGEESESLSIRGVVFPARFGKEALLVREKLQDIASQGEPLMMFDSEGNSLGQWVILAINSEKSSLTKDGFAKRIEFSFELKEFSPNGFRYKGV